MTALKAEAAAAEVATTVAEKVIAPRSALSRRRSSVATAMPKATPVASALSPVTVSPSFCSFRSRYVLLTSITDSRVKCSNCGEMGHTKVRCKQPVPNEDADDVGGNAGAGPVDAAPGGADMGGDFGSAEVGNDFGVGNSGGGDWGSGAAAGGAW